VWPLFADSGEIGENEEFKFGVLEETEELSKELLTALLFCG